MKIQSRPITSLPEMSRQEPEISSVMGKGGNFVPANAEIRDLRSNTVRSTASPEILELARKVSSGEVAQADAGRAFVEVVVAQNGGVDVYGKITDQLKAGIGDIVAQDPTFNAKIYRSLLSLAKQENK